MKKDEKNIWRDEGAANYFEKIIKIYKKEFVWAWNWKRVGKIKIKNLSAGLQKETEEFQLSYQHSPKYCIFNQTHKLNLILELKVSKWTEISGESLEKSSREVDFFKVFE